MGYIKVQYSITSRSLQPHLPSPLLCWSSSKKIAGLCGANMLLYDNCSDEKLVIILATSGNIDILAASTLTAHSNLTPELISTPGSWKILVPPLHLHPPHPQGYSYLHWSSPTPYCQLFTPPPSSDNGWLRASPSVSPVFHLTWSRDWRMLLPYKSIKCFLDSPAEASISNRFDAVPSAAVPYPTVPIAAVVSYIAKCCLIIIPFYMDYGWHAFHGYSLLSLYFTAAASEHFQIYSKFFRYGVHLCCARVFGLPWPFNKIMT